MSESDTDLEVCKRSPAMIMAREIILGFVLIVLGFVGGRFYELNNSVGIEALRNKNAALEKRIAKVEYEADSNEDGVMYILRGLERNGITIR